MKNFESIDAVLDFAIAREQEAVDFYVDLAQKTGNPTLQNVLEGFASAERGHKLKLQTIKTRHVELVSGGTATDLKIGDYLVEAEPGPEISFQDALLIAMKREKAAMQLYADLAGQVSDDEIREILLGLSEEESRHKLRFEAEYEEHFLSEN